MHGEMTSLTKNNETHAISKELNKHITINVNYKTLIKEIKEVNKGIVHIYGQEDLLLSRHRCSQSSLYIHCNPSQNSRRNGQHNIVGEEQTQKTDIT